MNTKPCPICRENHDPARGLSFDGKGLNSCSPYRDRIATFEPAYRQHGKTIARAVNSHDALCRAVAELLAEITHDEAESSMTRAEFDAMIVRADEAIAAAGGDPGRE